jgi:signal transduction histidine kinase/CheY-like chemotaxis protein
LRALWTRSLRWLGDLRAEPVDRRSAVTVQLFCFGLLLVLVINIGAVLIRCLRAETLSPALGEVPASLVTLVSVGASLWLIRRGRVRGAFILLCSSMIAVLATSLVIRGFHYHQFFLLRTAGVVLALPALLLGRRALWISLAALVVGAVVGELRDGGHLWGAGPLPPEQSALGLLGSALATMVLLALVLDRFGSALRVALRAAIGRQDQLERAARELADEASRRRRAEAQLSQVRKMEALGRLSGGVAHDFNNILTTILGCAELCARAVPEDSLARTDLDEIVAASKKGAQLTRQLLAFAREQPSAPRLIEAEGVVRALGRMLERLLGDRIALHLHLSAEPGVVRIDPTQLEQVLVNLAVNARDAMPAGGTLTIRTTLGAGGNGSEQPGGVHCIEVADTGMGMDESTRQRIFEPFFTTKGDGQGTGLGLATCYGIVRQAGGDITVETGPGRGTVFRIYLPRASGTPARRERPPLAEEAAGGEETILVVEDELSVRAATVRALRELGYETLEARDPLDADAVAARYPGKIDLLLTDLAMPHGGGRLLADRLRLARPGLRVLFMSGSAREAAGRRGLEPDFIEKPFTAAQIGPKVRAVLDAPPGSGL